MWNEKEVHRLDMWPWPHSWHDLDLGCFEVKFLNNYFENCWSDWCEMNRKRINRILGQLYDLALWLHPWPWPQSFKVRVWNSFISGMGQPIDMERKGCESSIHDHDIWLVWPWWGGQMYRVVNGVTSDVSVPSTNLVPNCPSLYYYKCPVKAQLTHWGWNKMAAIYQTTSSNEFSWMKLYKFWLRFHWSLYPRVQLTIFQHWCR